MPEWAHEQARELLELNVEQGRLSTTAELQVREELAAGETSRALQLLARYDNRAESGDR